MTSMQKGRGYKEEIKDFEDGRASIAANTLIEALDALKGLIEAILKQ